MKDLIELLEYLDRNVPCLNGKKPIISLGLGRAIDIPYITIEARWFSDKEYKMEQAYSYQTATQTPALAIAEVFTSACVMFLQYHS